MGTTACMSQGSSCCHLVVLQQDHQKRLPCPWSNSKCLQVHTVDTMQSCEATFGGPGTCKAPAQGTWRCSLGLESKDCKEMKGPAIMQLGAANWLSCSGLVSRACLPLDPHDML